MIALGVGVKMEETRKIDEKKLEENLINVYGITDNPKEAGYILKDGKMVDFSGRGVAQGYKKVNGKFVAEKDDYLKDSRTTDHRDLWEVFDGIEHSGKMSQEDRMNVLMKKTGAIRFSPNGGDINIHLVTGNSLTENQIAQIYKVHKQFGGTIYIDIIDAEGNLIGGGSKRNMGEVRRVYEQLSEQID